MADPSVAEMIQILEDGITPENDCKAREVNGVLLTYGKQRYTDS